MRWLNISSLLLILPAACCFSLFFLSADTVSAQHKSIEIRQPAEIYAIGRRERFLLPRLTSGRLVGRRETIPAVQVRNIDYWFAELQSSRPSRYRVAQAYIAHEGPKVLSRLDSLVATGDSVLRQRIKEIVAMMLIESVDLSLLEQHPPLMQLCRREFDAGRLQYKRWLWETTSNGIPNHLCEETKKMLPKWQGRSIWTIPALVEGTKLDCGNDSLICANELIRVGAKGQRAALERLAASSKKVTYIALDSTILLQDYSSDLRFPVGPIVRMKLAHANFQQERMPDDACNYLEMLIHFEGRPLDIPSWCLTGSDYETWDRFWTTVTPRLQAAWDGPGRVSPNVDFWIRRLRSSTPSEYRVAQVYLSHLGKEALPALERLAFTTDPTILERIREIVLLMLLYEVDFHTVEKYHQLMYVCRDEFEQSRKLVRYLFDRGLLDNPNLLQSSKANQVYNRLQNRDGWAIPVIIECIESDVKEKKAFGMILLFYMRGTGQIAAIQSLVEEKGEIPQPGLYGCTLGFWPGVIGKQAQKFLDDASFYFHKKNYFDGAGNYFDMIQWLELKRFNNGLFSWMKRGDPSLRCCLDSWDIRWRDRLPMIQANLDGNGCDDEPIRPWIERLHEARPSRYRIAQAQLTVMGERSLPALELLAANATPVMRNRLKEIVAIMLLRSVKPSTMKQYPNLVALCKAEFEEAEGLADQLLGLDYDEFETYVDGSGKTIEKIEHFIPDEAHQLCKRMKDLHGWAIPAIVRLSNHEDLWIRAQAAEILFSLCAEEQYDQLTRIYHGPLIAGSFNWNMDRGAAQLPQFGMQFGCCPGSFTYDQSQTSPPARFGYGIVAAKYLQTLARFEKGTPWKIPVDCNLIPSDCTWKEYWRYVEPILEKEWND